ncbi:hypothetical protein D3C85_975410 [compost metagenome]
MLNGAWPKIQDVEVFFEPQSKACDLFFQGVDGRLVLVGVCRVPWSNAVKRGHSEDGDQPVMADLAAQQLN